jgi:hypothetical protein
MSEGRPGRPAARIRYIEFAASTRLNADLICLMLPPAGPFPRIYAAKRGWRYAASIIGAAMIAGMVFGLYHVVFLNDPPLLQSKVVILLFLAVGVAMGAAMIVAPIRQRVILEAAGIEMIGLFRTRRLAYGDIGAKRAIRGTVPVWSIIPAQRGMKGFQIDMSYDFDAPFLDWLATIPPADAAFLAGRR